MHKYKEKQLNLKEKRIHTIKIYVLGIIAVLLFKRSLTGEPYHLVFLILGNIFLLAFGILFESYVNKYKMRKEEK